MAELRDKMQDNILDLTDAFDVAEENGDFQELEPFKIKVSHEPLDYVTFPNPFDTRDAFEMENVISFLQYLSAMGEDLARAEKRSTPKEYEKYKSKVEFEALRAYPWNTTLAILREWIGDDDFDKLRKLKLSVLKTYDIMATVAEYYSQGLTAHGDSKNS